MPRKKKQEVVEEPEVVEASPEEQVLMIQQPEEISPAAMRLQLLGLSKEILEHQSHLSWETNTKFIDVSIEGIIEGARELLDFIYEDYE
tara:strand:- start:2780 stop:3046 length:267 start_codon:yes stop_codon:yes gene_type:complete